MDNLKFVLLVELNYCIAFISKNYTIIMINDNLLLYYIQTHFDIFRYDKHFYVKYYNIISILCKNYTYNHIHLCIYNLSWELILLPARPFGWDKVFFYLI